MVQGLESVRVQDISQGHKGILFEVIPTPIFSEVNHGRNKSELILCVGCLGALMWQKMHEVRPQPRMPPCPVRDEIWAYSRDSNTQHPTLHTL